jgi:hypothetical protein
VYRPFRPTPGELAFAGAGAVFLIAGILLLTNRLAQPVAAGDVAKGV